MFLKFQVTYAYITYTQNGSVKPVVLLRPCRLSGQPGYPSWFSYTFLVPHSGPLSATVSGLSVKPCGFDCWCEYYFWLVLSVGRAHQLFTHWLSTAVASQARCQMWHFTTLNNQTLASHHWRLGFQSLGSLWLKTAHVNKTRERRSERELSLLFII